MNMNLTAVVTPPSIYRVDSMLGSEALVILANLSRLMAAKMYEPILHL